MNREILTSAFRRVRLRMLSRRRGEAGDDSEDALQEAFCRLWTRRDQISGPSEAEGLLAKAVRNIRIDSGRRRQAHPEVGLDDAPEDSYDASAADEEGEVIDRVERLAEQALSPRDREILYRRDRDDWDFDELAASYGLSESNVRMIVSRARKTIRELYRSGHALRDQVVVVLAVAGGLWAGHLQERVPDECVAYVHGVKVESEAEVMRLVSEQLGEMGEASEEFNREVADDIGDISEFFNTASI